MHPCVDSVFLNIKTNDSEKLTFISVQFSCATRVNYAGITTDFVYSMSSYFVGIKIWAVSLLSLSLLGLVLLVVFFACFS